MPIEEYVNKVIHGKALETIRTFPDKSVDCVITSPPYWQLRDYKWDGQWGLEPTFQMYLENLWSLMDEIWRVLKNSGTVWINLGDTYGGMKKGNDDTKHSGDVGNNINKSGGASKCLLLIPHRFAIGCMDKGWLVRNDIIWSKRNAMPEPVTDRFSKKHEYFFLLVKSEKYFFDLNAIRDKCPPLNRWGGATLIAKGESKRDDSIGQNTYRTREMQPNDGMKNPGDVSDFWDIPTKSSQSEHYAAYNTELIDKPILAGCPEGGIILDPFCGTATTLIRAKQLARKAIGIEGSEKYVEMANVKLEQAEGIHRTKTGVKIRQEKLF